MSKSRATGLVRYRAEVTEKKRASVMAASLKKFRQAGFNGTTMSGVADLAGVSTATLYKYYDNKEALFGACVEALLKEGGDGKTNDGRAIEFLEDVARAELRKIKVPVGFSEGKRVLREFVAVKKKTKSAGARS